MNFMKTDLKIAKQKELEKKLEKYFIKQYGNKENSLQLLTGLRNKS